MLCGRLSSYGSIAVSFSGGIDSTVLLAAAVRALPDRHIAVFADLPMLSGRQRATALNVAGELGADTVTIKLAWDDLPGIFENDRKRCYICKSAIYSAVRRTADEHGCDVCADGENSSDISDDRPGRKAAAEMNIVSPLKELGFSRSVIKKMFADLGLRAAVLKETCMLTRLPPDVHFSGDDVALVEECEEIIRNISGVKQIRMRIRDGYTELVTAPDETDMLFRSEDELSQRLAAKGISPVRINGEGYKE